MATLTLESCKDWKGLIDHLVWKLIIRAHKAREVQDG